MLKLAWRNITSKPLRAVATSLSIAVAVAMIFCILSFKSAVYDFIYQTETSKAGDSDIVIATNSSSDRIIDVASPLVGLDEVENVVPSLNLYAMLGNEYVALRGFEVGHLQDLQHITVKDGDIDAINNGEKEDDIVISQAAAEHFGLSVGNRFALKIGANEAHFYVGAIAEQSGYFLDDAPYMFVGLIKHVSRLLSGVSLESICNEIYVKLAPGASVENVINKILQIDVYSQMLVKASRDGGYVAEQTDGLTAPVVIAGVAVLALSIAIIVILFLMSEKEKISLISKLSVVGATRKQIFAVFLIESCILASIGAVIGSGLALGIFVGLLKLTLSSAVIFEISVVKLFISAVIGFASAIASSILPILRSFGGSIRENQQHYVSKRPKRQSFLPIAVIVMCVVCLIVEFCVPQATAIASVCSLALAVLLLATCATPVLKFVAKAIGKINRPSCKVASKSIVREKRFSRSVTMLSVGMSVSVMLFMAWVLTTSIFGSYVGHFSNMAFVTNFRQSFDVREFEDVDGVSHATKMVWGQGEIVLSQNEKTMNILGSKDVLDFIDFEYITPKDDVYNLISQDEPYVFVDIALYELYGVQVGDEITLTYSNTSQTVKVGGILKHELFSGNYIVASAKTMTELYGALPDTALIIIDGNVDEVVGALREKYASNNYYVVKTLDAYKWDMESMNAVFNLIGTLAAVVWIFVFCVSVFSSSIGRATAEKDRSALLNAGMSKRTLLKSEVLQYVLVALVSFVLSFLLSVLIASSLIHALRLFGLYFEFMYNAWTVALAGGVMAMAYSILPIVLNFKKHYSLQNRLRN